MASKALLSEACGHKPGCEERIQKGGGNIAQRVGPFAPKFRAHRRVQRFQGRIFMIFKRREAVQDLRSRAGDRQHDSDVGDVALRILDERNGAGRRRQLGRSECRFLPRVRSECIVRGSRCPADPTAASSTPPDGTNSQTRRPSRSDRLRRPNKTPSEQDRMPVTASGLILQRGMKARLAPLCEEIAVLRNPADDRFGITMMDAEQSPVV